MESTVKEDRVIFVQTGWLNRKQRLKGLKLAAESKTVESKLKRWKKYFSVKWWKYSFETFPIDNRFRFEAGCDTLTLVLVVFVATLVDLLSSCCCCRCCGLGASSGRGDSDLMDSSLWCLTEGWLSLDRVNKNVRKEHLFFRYSYVFRELFSINTFLSGTKL